MKSIPRKTFIKSAAALPILFASQHLPIAQAANHSAFKYTSSVEVICPTSNRHFTLALPLIHEEAHAKAFSASKSITKAFGAMICFDEHSAATLDLDADPSIVPFSTTDSHAEEISFWKCEVSMTYDIDTTDFIGVLEAVGGSWKYIRGIYKYISRREVEYAQSSFTYSQRGHQEPTSNSFYYHTGFSSGTVSDIGCNTNARVSRDSNPASQSSVLKVNFHLSNEDF